MDKYLWQYVMRINPTTKKEDVKEIKELNEWDLLIEYKNGNKVIYDTYTNYFKNVFYDDISELTEEQEKKEFAYRLRSLIKRNFITQEQLAESVDKSPVMISRYINGDSIPSVIVARKIAKALGCSLDDFFYKQF